MLDVDKMAPVAIVTALILIEYFVFAILVGRERVRTKIEAPATTGDPIFERYFRVHQNSLEQLIIVLPAMWLFSGYISVTVGAGLGLVFFVGRILYLRGYVADPQKRGLGFGIGILAEVVLILGALGGAVLTYLR